MMPPTGQWVRFVDSLPEAGRTVLVCGEGILQLCTTSVDDDGRLKFVDSPTVIGQPLFLGYADEDHLSHWSYVLAPNGDECT